MRTKGISRKVMHREESRKMGRVAMYIGWRGGGDSLAAYDRIGFILRRCWSNCDKQGII